MSPRAYVIRLSFSALFFFCHPSHGAAIRTVSPIIPLMAHIRTAFLLSCLAGRSPCDKASRNIVIPSRSFGFVSRDPSYIVILTLSKAKRKNPVKLIIHIVILTTPRGCPEYPVKTRRKSCPSRRMNFLLDAFSSI